MPPAAAEVTRKRRRLDNVGVAGNHAPRCLSSARSVEACRPLRLCRHREKPPRRVADTPNSSGQPRWQKSMLSGAELGHSMVWRSKVSTRPIRASRKRKPPRLRQGGSVLPIRGRTPRIEASRDPTFRPGIVSKGPRAFRRLLRAIGARPSLSRANQAVRPNLKCVFILTASRAGGFAGTIKLGKRTKSVQRRSPSGWPTGSLGMRWVYWRCSASAIVLEDRPVWPKQGPTAFKARSSLNSCDGTSAASRRLDCGNVDLLHAHHGFERAPCFIATHRQRLGQHAGRDLP